MKLAKLSFLVAVATAMLASCAAPKQDTAQTVLDTILARKSVRSYTDQDVTPEQVETLLGLGCDVIQGYYYDKPLSVEVFEERIRTRRYVNE